MSARHKRKFSYSQSKRSGMGREDVGNVRVRCAYDRPGAHSGAYGVRTLGSMYDTDTDTERGYWLVGESFLLGILLLVGVGKKKRKEKKRKEKKREAPACRGNKP